jgi:hypothetical protein
VMYRSVLWAGVSGELPLTTPMGRCQLYATANIVCILFVATESESMTEYITYNTKLCENLLHVVCVRGPGV